MKRSNRWPRRAGAALAAALLASTGLGIGAGSVGAIPAGGLSVSTTSPPTSIGLGMLNQPGGTLRIAPTVPTETFAMGDQIRVFLDDSDGVDANCVTATDFVTFASVPTVTNSGTATFTASIEESPGVCTAFAGTYNDVLLISITGAGTGVFDVAGIMLDNGPTTATGRISHTVVESPDSVPANVYPTGGPPANGVAFIAPLLLTANNPPMGAIEHPSLFQSPSPIVISEPSSTPAAADGLTLCIELAGGNTFDTTGAAPTVTVSGAGSTDTTSVVTRAAGTLSFTVTAGAPVAASTFTVSGFRTTRTADGPDFVTLATAACPGADVTLPTTISTVIELDRFGGGTRFDTAALAFEDYWGTCGGGATAIVASGENFPDALSSTYLADSMGTGILLTSQNSVPGSMLNVLRTTGVDSVHLIGGPAAISAGVEDQLKATPNYSDGGCGDADPPAGPYGAIETNGLAIPLSLSVIRIAGATRYETMKNVVEFPGFGAAGDADFDGTLTDPDGPICAPLVTAVVATGENFPDALTAGQFAVGSDIGCGDGDELPVILTPSGALGAEASQAMINLGIEQVIIAGGTSAVSTAVETAIGAMGIATRRLAGPTRLDTAVAMATFKAQFMGAHDDSVLIVRGDNFADALAAPAWGGHNTNMVLAESPTSLGAPTATYLATVDNIFPLNGGPVLDPFDELWLFGGSSAITDPVLAAILAQLSLVESPE